MSQSAQDRGPSWVERRVLVVDDESTARRALAWLFADVGVEVTAVSNGDEALASLAVTRFDLLLTDMRMPGIDGIDLMRRALILDPELTVVLMTAFADVQTAVRAMSDGAFWYVTKPVDVDGLMDVMDRAFELRALRLSAREGAGAARASGAAEVAPEVPGATLAALERHAILATVRAAQGDLVAAARTLGVGLPFLAARLRSYEEAP